MATIKKFQRSDHARLFNLERRSHLWESWSQVQRHYQVCFFFALSMYNVYGTQCTIVQCILYILEILKKEIT